MVVEHDEEIMRAADAIIDIGPASRKLRKDRLLRKEISTKQWTSKTP